MKKTLAAVAVLGAFAGSALAADVQLYGIVDTGVGYNHVDVDGLGDKQDIDTFQMKSGQASGSRWGLKGTEDLGNGLTVGFILEDGFSSDTGADSAPMFNRESSLFIEGGFGKLAMGRMGSLNNGQSSWAKVGMINAFGTSDWGDYSVQVGMGNTVTDYDSVENESSSDRYYALGATYNNGPFAAYFAVDSINYASWDNKTGTGEDMDDSLTVTLGGSYDFEAVKVYLGAQYFDEVKLSNFKGVIKAAGVGQSNKVKGYGISLTGDAPVLGGKAMFGIGYTDAESADSEDKSADVELQRYVVSVGYDYPFSKRTDVYAVASYMQDSWEDKSTANKVEGDPSAYTLYVGLRHRF